VVGPCPLLRAVQMLDDARPGGGPVGCRLPFDLLVEAAGVVHQAGARGRP
jgi:hypothetical protein